MVHSYVVLLRKPALFSSLLIFSIVASTTGQILKDSEWLLENDKSCLSEGGICVVADYCDEADRSNSTGLCQEQDSRGVCCYGVPEEASCYWQGGECMEDCGGVTNFGQKECSDGKTCCLLI